MISNLVPWLRSVTVREVLPTNPDESDYDDDDDDERITIIVNNEKWACAVTSVLQAEFWCRSILVLCR